MPLPFIIGGAAIAAGALGIGKGVQGGRKIREASKRIDAAETRYNREKGRLDADEREIRTKLTTLGELKLNLNKDLFRFTAAFEKIHNRPEFSGYSQNHPSITKHELDEIKKVSITAVELLGTTLLSSGAGALAGYATYGSVMALGAASTGTPIAALSGIAAQNAALAALGGGSIAAGGGGIALGSTILAGAAIAPIIAVGGLLVNAKGNSSLEKATEIEAEVEKAVITINNARTFINKLTRVTNEMRNEVSALSGLYYTHVVKLEKLVEHKTDWDQYDDDEQVIVDNNIKLVALIVDVLKQPLVVKKANDELGEVQQSAVADLIQKSQKARHDMAED